MVCYLWRSEAHLELENQKSIIGSTHGYTRDVTPHRWGCRLKKPKQIYRSVATGHGDTFRHAEMPCN
jgi:hypothetical protein